MKRYLGNLLIIMLFTASLTSAALAQQLRLGASVQTVPRTLSFEFLGMENENMAEFAWEIGVNVDMKLSEAFSTSFGTRIRGTRYANGSIGMDGSIRCSSGTNGRQDNDYYSVSANVLPSTEFPLQLRYHVNRSVLSPFILGGVFLGHTSKGSEATAWRYLAGGEQERWSAPMNRWYFGIDVGVGMDARISSLFSLMADITYTRALTPFVNDEAIRVTDAGGFSGRVLFMFTLSDGEE